jgi:PIN domain nuclease of toxin-antitoxin system
MVKYVLDACALIALFKKESGFEEVRDLVKAADAGEIAVYMSIVNLLEVYYGFIGSDGMVYATTLMNKVYDSAIKIIATISPPVYQNAARLKGTYRRISLADSVGLATAASIGGTFVTSDHHELDVIEQHEPIMLLWIR